MVTNSRSRRAWQCLCCLAFALCLSLGLTFLEGFSSNGYADVTEAVADETMTWPSEATVETVPEPILPQTQSAQRHPLAAWALLAGAAVFQVVYICLSRQDRPYLGPEAELLLTGLLVGVIFFFRGYPWRMGAAALPLPVLIGNLFAWVRHGFSLDWSSVHRLAMMPGKFSDYVVVETLASTVFLGGGVLMLYLRIWSAGLWGLAAGGIALACLIRMGMQVDGLKRQIAGLASGQETTPVDSLFLPEEASLAAIRQQRDEAIRAAVTGERFKVDLISNVSHDLRTPLTAILGYGELLEGENLSPEAAERLRMLNRKAGYLRDLVEELFELTKVSSGAMEPQLSEIDLNRLLEQTVGLLDDKLTERGLEVRKKYCAQRMTLTTDGTRMHRVFANLLENAIKYALPGTRIYLETRDMDDRIEVRMTNTASYEMDFTPEEIVQRFARGDKARSTRGSGLGLAIAQTYSQSVGGDFRVEVDGDQFRAVVTLPK